MSYEIRHFDTPLIRFSATEDSSSPEIRILWVNDQEKALLPLDLQLTNDGMGRWLKHRTIPKNRAHAHNFLSKCGLSVNRPMSIIKVSKGLSLNDCYWVVRKVLPVHFLNITCMRTDSARFLRSSRLLVMAAVSAPRLLPARNSPPTACFLNAGEELTGLLNYIKAAQEAHPTPGTNRTRSSMLIKLPAP